MLAKPFTILFVFILAVANFLVMALVLSVLVFPIFIFFREIFLSFGPSVFFYLVAKTAIGILIYIVLDTIFGLTLRRTLKGCVKFKKANYVYCHAEILESFEWLKNRFKMKNVTLYLDPTTSVVNAYAIGGFSGSAVTVTLGLINQMQMGTSSPEEFLDAVRGILGHEMSHLSNKDFLPGLITSASQNISAKTSRVIRIIFIFVSKICRFIPFIGKPISNLIITLYNLLNFILMAFFKIIFLPIYNFLQKVTSRSIEYRCDRESAYAYGGPIMAKGLSLLGKSGYISLFSTHPTTKSRIQSVEKVLPRGGTIRPGIINVLSNIIALSLIIFICIASSRIANAPNMQERYRMEIHNPIKNKIEGYQRSIEKFKKKFSRKPKE